MTRENAFEEYESLDYADDYFTSGKVSNGVEKLIDRIFDESEAEIKRLKKIICQQINRNIPDFKHR